MIEEQKQFSDKIQVFLNTHFPDRNIYDMSLEELQLFKKEVTQKRQEYSLLEIGAKILSNAAYGACASPFFYFFNPSLAGDITGECRELTQTMWKNLENFFHVDIWERKDLWEKFDFELDETKREWLMNQHISVYSDTDSCKNNSLLLIKDKNNYKKKLTIEELFDIYLKLFGLKTIDDTGHELVECDCKVLNYVDNKVQYTPIKHIIRHKVSKPKFKIKTKSGKEIIVTGDHSIIVFRNGKQLAIKAKDINIKTDKILSVIKNNEENNI